MKTILFIAFFSFMGTLKAQGNLQFNQTLLLSTTQASNVLLGTVPAGKVWKVEGFGSGNSGASECAWSFDGTNAAFRSGNVYVGGTAYQYSNSTSTFWLPSGTTVYSLNCSSNYRWISIIEFNIVP
ncbi:MAG: hypothetical protein EBV19_10270 [Flavobacteriia bacterium]|jgi:hypothetical protein|nr:hypothetical protein [Flavobacteriia bacterium]